MIRANLLLRTHFSELNPISHVTESVTPRIRLDMVRLLVTTNLRPTTRFNHLGFSSIICRCANGLPFWITFARNFRGLVVCGSLLGGSLRFFAISIFVAMPPKNELESGNRIGQIRVYQTFDR